MILKRLKRQSKQLKKEARERQRKSGRSYTLEEMAESLGGDLELIKYDIAKKYIKTNEDGTIPKSEYERYKKEDLEEDNKLIAADKKEKAEQREKHISYLKENSNYTWLPLEEAVKKLGFTEKDAISEIYAKRLLHKKLDDQYYIPEESIKPYLNLMIDAVDNMPTREQREAILTEQVRATIEEKEQRINEGLFGNSIFRYSNFISRLNQQD